MLYDLYYFSELPVMQNKLGINIPFWIKVNGGIDTVAAISLTSEVMDKRKLLFWIPMSQCKAQGNIFAVTILCYRKKWSFNNW